MNALARAVSLARHVKLTTDHEMVRDLQDQVRDLQLANAAIAAQCKQQEAEIAELRAGIERRDGEILQLKTEIKLERPDNPAPAELAMDLRHIKLKEIIAAVSDRTGVSAQGILSHRKMVRMVRARQIAWFLASEITRLHFAEIARRMCRDHTSVMHGVRKIEGMIPVDSELAEDIAAIRNALGVG